MAGGLRCQPQGTHLRLSQRSSFLREMSRLIKKQQSREGNTQARLAVLSPHAFQTRIHSLAGFRPSISKISSLCLSTKECSWAPPTSNKENNSHCHHLFLEMKPYIGRLNPESQVNSPTSHYCFDRFPQRCC